MYARLLQGYEAMEPDLQVASANAARQLRLMVSLCIIVGGLKILFDLFNLFLTVSNFQSSLLLP